jgi:hypothetical protein
MLSTRFGLPAKRVSLQTRCGVLAKPWTRVADRAETELLELADDLLGLDLGPLCSHRHDFRDASSHLNIFQQTRTGLL